MVRVCTYICDIGSSMIVEMQKEGRSKQGHANNKAKQHNTTIFRAAYVLYVCDTIKWSLGNNQMCNLECLRKCVYIAQLLNAIIILHHLHVHVHACTKKFMDNELL